MVRQHGVPAYAGNCISSTLGFCANGTKVYLLSPPWVDLRFEPRYPRIQQQRVDGYRQNLKNRGLLLQFW